MYSYSIDIAAAPEAVFDELSHVERHPTWANPKAGMTMEQVEGDGPGPQARYRSSGVFVNKDVTADIAVTSFEPDRRFAIRSDQHQPGKSDVWYLNSYALEPIAGGTRLVKSTDSNGSKVVTFDRPPGDQEGRDDLADEPEAAAGIARLSPSASPPERAYPRRYRSGTKGLAGWRAAVNGSGCCGRTCTASSAGSTCTATGRPGARRTSAWRPSR